MNEHVKEVKGLDVPVLDVAEQPIGNDVVSNGDAVTYVQDNDYPVDPLDAVEIDDGKTYSKE